MVIQPKLMEGHPMILGIPWLATTDAYIGYRNGEMIISNGLSTKKVTLHQPAQPVVYNPLLLEDPYEIQDNDQPLIDVNQTRDFQEKIEEHILDQFLSSNYQENLDYYTDSTPFNDYEHIFGKEFQETSSLENSLNSSICTIDKILEPSVKPIEISPGKLLYISSERDLVKQ